MDRYGNATRGGQRGRPFPIRGRDKVSNLGIRHQLFFLLLRILGFMVLIFFRFAVGSVLVLFY